MLPWQSLSNTSRLFMALQIGWGNSRTHRNSGKVETSFPPLSFPQQPQKMAKKNMPVCLASNSSKLFDMETLCSSFPFYVPYKIPFPKSFHSGVPIVLPGHILLPREQARNGQKGQEYPETQAFSAAMRWTRFLSIPPITC